LPSPDIQQYLRECDEVLIHIDEGGRSPDVVEDMAVVQYPADYVELAKSIGDEMLAMNDHGAWAGVWAKERAEVKSHFLKNDI
jgi:hypothetical protein